MITTGSNQANEKMTAEQFVYWLQGWLEIADPAEITVGQLNIIKRHLGYVFKQGHLPSTVAQSFASLQPSAMIC